MLRRACRALGLAVVALAAAAPGIPQSTRVLAQGTVQTQPIDPFGQDVTLPEKTIVYTTGSGSWDTAYDTLKEAFKTLQDYLDKEKLTAAGPALTIYTAMDDVSFNFQAAVPLASAPTTPQGNIGTGTSPGGKALKFVHRGSFDSMTATYDTISHFVEEKQIASKELLIEEYMTDILKTEPDKLVINIFVPID
ncbi:MAG: hypothetical protein QOC56_1129 [Alphaproteobacteria bacterium]|nr:hypothetical protein [Alphaproteobacteria bacterium]